jgi:hypothetical protein
LCPSALIFINCNYLYKKKKDVTLESLSDFKLRFPTFALVDKGHFKDGGVLHTYVRHDKSMKAAEDAEALVEEDPSGS